MAELVDETWLVDTVTITKTNAKADDWQKPIEDEAVVLSNVRVDMAKQYTGSGNNRSIVANATVFMFAAFTDNYFEPDDAWLNARLTYKGYDYLIKDFSIYHDIDSNDPYSVELRVI